MILMHAIQFASLGDVTRFRLVEMLREKPLPVHVLTAAFSISRPAISRHLRVLKDAGLVVEEKQGRENLYKLQTAHLTPVSLWLTNLCAPELAAPIEPARVASPKLKKRPALEVPAPPKETPPEKVQPLKKVKPAAPAPSQNQMAWEF
jgi:DNA-binding transcriptional ArsR family regulator